MKKYELRVTFDVPDEWRGIDLCGYVGGVMESLGNGAVAVGAIESLSRIDGRLDLPTGSDAPVRDLGLNTRTRKAVEWGLKIQTIAQLIETPIRDLMLGRHFGIACLNEVRRKLASRGLRLREDVGQFGPPPGDTVCAP